MNDDLSAGSEDHPSIGKPFRTCHLVVTFIILPGNKGSDGRWKLLRRSLQRGEQKKEQEESKSLEHQLRSCQEGDPLGITTLHRWEVWYGGAI
jgi:hypothetical protein